MNYDQQITRLIAELKIDKSIAQPWKNYAMKELNMAQAAIRMGKTTSNLTPPAGMRIEASESLECICPEGAEAFDCPVHGR